MLAFKTGEENDVVVSHKEMGNLLVKFINKVADFTRILFAICRRVRRSGRFTVAARQSRLSKC